MYQYVLFDLDGTISDPKTGITRSVQYALKAFGIEEPDPDKLEPFIGPPLLDSFMEFYGMNREQAETAIGKYRERFSVTGLYENELYPGIRTMLENLKNAGCHLAVASSKPEVFVKKILDYFEITQFFDAIVGSELDGRRVNKDEVVLEALNRLAVCNERHAADGKQYNERHAADGNQTPLRYADTVMVGDRKFDVIGARAMGLHSIAVRYGYAQGTELEESKPDHIAEDVAELERILLADAAGTDLNSAD